MNRTPPRTAAGPGDLLELLDRGHHCLAGRVREDSPEIPYAVRAFRIRKSAGLEHPGDLPIELGAVGDDDHGGLLLRLVAAELEREPEHREALSRALRVPDDPAPRARLSGTANPPHRFVDRDELLVTGELSDLAAAVAVEHHEVPHQVEEVPRLEESEERNVLRRRRAPELLAELHHRQGIRLLPRKEESLGGADRAVNGALTAGCDEDLRRLEQLRRALILPTRIGFLIAAELLDRVGFPGVADCGALALDDREREAVAEHHDVGNDVLLRSEHLVLPGDDPLVAIRFVEVEEPERVALASVAAVLLQGDAVGERRVERLVRLGETRGGNLRHCFHGLGDVGLREPGIEPLQGRGEASAQDGLLDAPALRLQDFGRDTGVAEGLQQLERGVLREMQLVPAGRLRVMSLWGQSSSAALTPASSSKTASADSSPAPWRRAQAAVATSVAGTVTPRERARRARS